MGSKLQKNVLTSKFLCNNLLEKFLLQCQCRGARLYVYVLAPLHWHWNGTKDCWNNAFPWGRFSRTPKTCNAELTRISHRSTRCHLYQPYVKSQKLVQLFDKHEYRSRRFFFGWIPMRHLLEDFFGSCYSLLL